MTVLGLLQAGMYDAFTEDDPLMAKIVGVYDYVPVGTDFPYLVIGEASETPWDTLKGAASSEGYSVQETIYIASAYAGYKEAQDILVEVERILNAGITVTGYNVVVTTMSRKTTRRDDSNMVRYIPLMVSFIVQKA